MLASLRTRELELHYHDDGPADGRPVVLLHGWPDAPDTWDQLLPGLHAAGYRTLRPYLRGFGPTRILQPGGPRSGQLGAIATDIIEFIRAVTQERVFLIGHDWGARCTYIIASQAPELLRRCAALSVGYGRGNGLSLRQAQNYWYQWFFNTPQGEQALAADRRAFCRYLWQAWAPDWRFDDATFERAAQAFDNPDWLEVTLHSYRQRWGLAAGDSRYYALERALSAEPPIRVPTLVLHGADDACNDPSTSAGREHHFVAGLRRLVLPGVGHFPQREAPTEVLAAITEWFAAA